MALLEKSQARMMRGARALIAFLMLFQIALSGAALASPHRDGAAGVVACSSPATTSIDGKSAPAPAQRHHAHGECCILHCGALGAPAVKIIFSLLLEAPAERLEPQALFAAPEPRMEPRRAPQSPRAPPALQS